MLLGTSCAVSGTGFLFSRQVLARQGGWPFHLLTEDIQFTAACLLAGERIGYCPQAVFYDEQPVDFGQSWRQRLRWARGYVQVLRHYGLGLLRGLFRKGGFACFDMLMSILPRRRCCSWWGWRFTYTPPWRTCGWACLPSWPFGPWGGCCGGCMRCFWFWEP